MQKKVWIVIIAAAILALAGGAITAQNILNGDREPVAERAASASEVFNGTGNLTGRIDSHSVEIEVDGEPRVFGLSNGLREAEFAPGPISFKYKVDENGRSILTEAEWTKAGESAVQTADGIFNGQADSHTIEVRVGREDRSFAFAGGIAVDNLHPGDKVNFDYREDPNGRLVIVRLVKTGSGESSDPTGENKYNGEGIFTGRIDNHSVEIEINGEPRVFGLSDGLREAEFATGPISFKYYVDKNGRSIITEAEFTKDEGGAVQTAEGVFNGQADSHTVEIEIAGEARAFGLAVGISFTGITEGEQVFIAYREMGGRPVIIKVERLA